MLKIGITGNIGAGKSFVSRLFNIEHNIPIYYTDIVAYNISNRPEVLEKYIEIFGPSAISSNGKVNRQFVANILFSDTDKRNAISSYIAILMKDDFDNWCAIKRIAQTINKKNKKVPYILCESAIFDETNTKHFVDLMLGVTAPLAIRMERVMKRNSLSESEFLLRNTAQLNQDDKIANCDFVLSNNNDNDIYENVANLDKLFRKIATINNPNLG